MSAPASPRRPDPIARTPAPPATSAAARTAARAAFRDRVAAGACHPADRQRLAEQPQPRIRPAFN